MKFFLYRIPSKFVMMRSIKAKTEKEARMKIRKLLKVKKLPKIFIWESDSSHGL